MWMIDMVVYTVLYATIVMLILSPIMFWLVDLVDIIIKDITSGDKVNYLRDNGRGPFMKKLGFTFDDCHLSKGEYILCGEVLRVDDIFIVLSLIFCGLGSIILTVLYFEKGIPPYQALSTLVGNVTPYSTWIILPAGYLMLRGILKKIYTLIKKVNSLPDTPVDNK
jgi:hypothetical protein